MVNYETVTVQIGDHERQFTVNELPYIISGNVKGRASFFRNCLNFYGGGKVYSKDFHPWDTDNPTHVELFAQALQDKTLNDLCMSFYKWEQEFILVNSALFDALTDFFSLPQPPTVDSYKDIVQKRKRYKNLETPIWAKKENFQHLIQKLKMIVDETEKISSQIYHRLQRVFPDFIPYEEFGEQQAKDLIDKADGVGISSKRGIRYLKKALEFGEKGLQASKAHLLLAMAYEDLDDLNQAINHYTLSLEAWRPYPFAFFQRGKLYYQLSRISEAHSDFQEASKFPISEWGNLNEYESAKKYLESIGLSL